MLKLKGKPSLFDSCRWRSGALPDSDFLANWRPWPRQLRSKFNFKLLNWNRSFAGENWRLPTRTSPLIKIFSSQIEKYLVICHGTGGNDAVNHWNYVWFSNWHLPVPAQLLRPAGGSLVLAEVLLDPDTYNYTRWTVVGIPILGSAAFVLTDDSATFEISRMKGWHPYCATFLDILNMSVDLETLTVMIHRY